MPLTKTERMRRYREKLKNDVERREKYLEYDRERKKLERLKTAVSAGKNKGKLAEIRQKKRDEMRLYRQRKRERQAEENRTPPIEGNRSKAATERQKKKMDRMRKQMKRKLIDEQKKTAVKRTQNWRLKIKLQRSAESRSPDKEKKSPAELASPYTSRWTEARATRKAKQSLPETPQKRAYLVTKLMDSPRTSQILSRSGRIINKNIIRRLRMGEIVLQSLKVKVNDTKSRGTRQREKFLAYKSLRQITASALAKKYRLKNRLMQNISLRRNAAGNMNQWWQVQARKRRKDSIPDNVKNLITDFFLSSEISRENPGKRYVMQVDGNKVQRHCMTVTLKEAFTLFKQKHPAVKVGFTMFRTCKPIQVYKVSETSRRTCLCMKCCNCALKAEAIKKLLAISGDDYASLPSSKDAFASLTFCSEPSSQCLNRTCKKCTSKAIRKTFENLEENTKEEIEWAKWEYVNVQKDGKVKRVVSCVPKKTKFGVLLDDLELELDSYPAHIFRAKWQQMQMQKCLESLSEVEAMMVMDFAENYSCRYKDEIATAFFDQVQITIHPMMLYYRRDGILLKHALIGISDETRHDSFVVRMFENAAFEVLCKKVPNIKRVHQWSDGCGVQYKAKTAFAIISQRATDGTIQVRRNYFETSHGKSVCDGLGAIVKNSAHQAVVSGKNIIAGASDLYQHCNDVLSHDEKATQKDDEHSIRSFIFLECSSIERNISGTDVQTLKGTRQIHAVEGTGEVNGLRVRELSCYCQSCVAGSDSCENFSHVRPWESRVLHRSILKDANEKDATCILKGANCKFIWCVYY